MTAKAEHVPLVFLRFARDCAGERGGSGAANRPVFPPRAAALLCPLFAPHQPHIAVPSCPLGRLASGALLPQSRPRGRSDPKDGTKKRRGGDSYLDFLVPR
jgi:hypothetical protein